MAILTLFYGQKSVISKYKSKKDLRQFGTVFRDNAVFPPIKSSPQALSK